MKTATRAPKQRTLRLTRSGASLDSLVKLADALEVSVDALLGRAPEEKASQLDPIFLRASRASAQTLDTVRRVTEALLASMEQK